MNYFDFLFRISVCFILGIAIGLERQIRMKNAGIRTITLVALGAFLFVSISSLLVGGDITRIAAQVVSGIGFLGAGVILRDGINIRGINTAATLWCSSAIGSLTALGLIKEAATGVIYILMANILLRCLSKKLLKRTIRTKITNCVLTLLGAVEKENSIKNSLIQKLKFRQMTIKSFSTRKVDNCVELRVNFELKDIFIDDIHNIINKLCLEQGVISVAYSEIPDYTVDDDYSDK